MRVGYEFEYADQDSHRVGRRQGSFREICGHHDEEYTVTRLHRVTGAVDLTDRVSVEVRLPYVSRSHAHIHRHGGRDLAEAWSVAGLGDLSVLARYAFWRPQEARRPMLSAIVGVEFPTGWYRAENGAGDDAELGIQPGSHSRDLIAGLSSLQRFDAPMLGGQFGTLPVSASVVAQFNGRGTDEYRLGDTLQMNLGTAYPVWPTVSALAQLNFLWRDRDAKGRTGEEIQKTGGEFLYLSPGVEWRPAADWRAYAMIQVPVYQRVNLIQVTSDYNVLAGLSYRFDAWGRTRRRR